MSGGIAVPSLSDAGHCCGVRACSVPGEKVVLPCLADDDVMRIERNEWPVTPYPP